MAATGLRLWDRLILFLAWTVTCGLVYLLGFYVGKGIQAQRLDTEERAIRLPITQGPPPEGHRPKSDLMFYDKLASNADRPSVPTPDPAPPPKATTGTLPPRAATATTVPPPPAPTPTTTPAAPRPTTTVAPRAATPPSTTPPRTVATTPPPAARPAERPAPAPEEPRASRAEPPPTSGRGTWSVQAAPTRSRADADALLRRLRSKGYDATIVEVPRDGATWYRIRVGRYATAGQATEAMQRLRDQEGVSHVFVASE